MPQIQQNSTSVGLCQYAPKGLQRFQVKFELRVPVLLVHIHLLPG